MNNSRIPFVKYHGTGNDFVIINHLTNQYIDIEDHALIAAICHRRFGIGADGVMIIEKSMDENLDFNMLYYNSDGKPSSMCGNGGRCITAAYLDLQKRRQSNNISFSFKSDRYQAVLQEDTKWIQLQMQNVDSIESDEENYVLDTGSPHFVKFLDNIDSLDVKKAGSVIRYNPRYKENGINVNFCEWNGSELAVRTYERGVEDETYSCGTGVVASSIAYSLQKQLADGLVTIPLTTKGGNLSVSFKKDGRVFYKYPADGTHSKICEGGYYK